VCFFPVQQRTKIPFPSSHHCHISPMATTTFSPSASLSFDKAIMKKKAATLLLLVFTNFLQQITTIASAYSTSKNLESFSSDVKDQRQLVETKTSLACPIISSSSNENCNLCSVSGSGLHGFHFQIWFDIIAASLLGMCLLLLTKMQILLSVTVTGLFARTINALQVLGSIREVR
jgi:hypothetical protein